MGESVRCSFVGCRHDGVGRRIVIGRRLGQPRHHIIHTRRQRQPACLGEGLRASAIGCPTYAQYVTSAGRVGIGTTAPSTTLHILDNCSGLRIGRAGNYVSLFENSGESFLDTTQTDLYIRTINSNRSLIFGTASTERARITGGGLMGVGTASPNATLQVSGSMIVSVRGKTTTPTLYVGTNGLVGIGTSNPSTYRKLHVVSTDGSVDPVEIDVSGNGGIKLSRTAATTGNI